MSWLEFRITEVIKKVQDQKTQIEDLIHSGEGEDATIEVMYKNLTEYLSNEKSIMLESAKIEFNDEYDQCSVDVNGYVTDITDTGTIGDILEIIEAGETLNQYGWEWLAMDDREIISELPLTPNRQTETFDILGRAKCYALIAYQHNCMALDELTFVSTYKFNKESQKWDYRRCRLLDASPEEQAINILIATNHALEASECIQAALWSKKQSQTGLLRDSAVRMADKIISERAKSKAQSRHANSYKIQNKIIEVYEVGNYRQRFNEEGKKTDTSRWILRKVNEWCNEVGITPLKDSLTGGVKTVRRYIEKYEKNKAKEFT